MAYCGVETGYAQVIRLDGATVLLQWATGGLAFLWITTRHRLVGLGYGWLLRLVFASIAIGAAVASRFTESVPVRDVASIGVALAASAAFAVSFLRRKAGVREQRVAAEKKKARVQSMMAAASAKVAPMPRSGAISVPAGPLQGSDAIAAALARAAAVKNAAKSAPRSSDSVDSVDSFHSVEALGAAVGDETATATMEMRDQFGRLAVEPENEMVDGPEFPPVLDLIAPAIGFIGLVAAGWAGGGNPALAIARTLVGALFLGAVSDAMLLGHWYLVQPGLSRRPIGELNTWLLRIWPIEVALLLVPTGMISVLNGTISDNYGGMLGWFWVACALTTGILGFVTRLALKERFYSAVMAATGLLYLAILTAFGTDLVARAILAA